VDNRFVILFSWFYPGDDLTDQLVQIGAAIFFSDHGLVLLVEGIDGFFVFHRFGEHGSTSGAVDFHPPTTGRTTILLAVRAMEAIVLVFAIFSL
jgi:hypothetical protein